MKLRVIIRDNSPFIHMQEPPKHRLVTINLNKDQEKMINLNFIGNVGSIEYYEEISECFIEE